jgi:CheY-like chemotaxis protein
MLCIEVEDTGIGIPADKLETLGSSFVQVADHNTRGRDGLGLGLSLVKEIVRIHKGSMTISSVFGRGTCVTVKFPVTVAESQNRPLPPLRLARDTSTPILLTRSSSTTSESFCSAETETFPAPASTLTPTPATSPDTGRRVVDPGERAVLVVDDNSLNLKIIGSMVERCGFATVRATDGKMMVDTVKRLGVDHFGLVITDLMMPEMDGVEACKQLRTTLGIPSSILPVIFLTAKSDGDTKDAIKTAGGDATLSKPVQKTEVEATIQKFFRSREARPAPKS